MKENQTKKKSKKGKRSNMKKDEIKIIIILFIIVSIFVILLANNVKRIEKEARKMTVDWETYTCDIE